MVDSPSSPPPVNPNVPQGVQQPGDAAQDSGKTFTTKPLKFLGMSFDSEQAAKLWQAIIQMVNSQIQKDKEAAIKAIRNFGKDEDEKEQ